MQIDIWIALISMIGGLLGGLGLRVVEAQLAKPKTQSETAAHYADAASSAADAMAEAYRRLDVLTDQQLTNIAEIAKLKSTVSAHQHTIDLQSRTIARFRAWAVDVMTGINVLIAQIREMGQEPRWHPSPVETDKHDDARNSA